MPAGTTGEDSAIETRGDRRAASVGEVARAVLESCGVEATIRTILEKACELTAADAAGLFEHDPPTGRLRWSRAVGFDTAAIAEVSLQLREGVAGRAVAEGRPFATTDVQNDPAITLAPPLRAWLERHGVRALLAVPFSAPGLSPGALTVYRRVPAAFSAADREALETLASLAAVALRNVLLHEATERRARQLAVLNTVVQRLVALLDPQEVGAAILAGVQQLMPDTAGRLWALNAAGELNVLASTGLREPHGGVLKTFRPGVGALGVAVAQRRSLALADVRTDPRFVNRAWAQSEGLVSALIVPLIEQERVHGMLAVFTRAPHEFTPEEIELLETFGGQAAIALQNARLYAEATMRARRMRRVAELSRLVSESLDLERVYAFVVRAARELLDVDFSRLWLLEENGEWLALAAESSREREGALPGAPDRRPMGASLVGQVLRTRRWRYIVDPTADPEVTNREWLSRQGITALITVPLLVGQRPIGALAVHAREQRPFSLDEIELLEVFAAQAAVAIENARFHAAAIRAAEQESVARGRLEGIALAARELAHLLNNDLSLAVGLVDLIKFRSDVPPDLLDLLGDAAQGLESAVRHVQQLQQVARIETKDTPAGPALDLERSAQP